MRRGFAVVLALGLLCMLGSVRAQEDDELDVDDEAVDVGTIDFAHVVVHKVRLLLLQWLLSSQHMQFTHNISFLSLSLSLNHTVGGCWRRQAVGCGPQLYPDLHRL